jgi:signal peptidase
VNGARLGPQRAAAWVVLGCLGGFLASLAVDRTRGLGAARQRPTEDEGAERAAAVSETVVPQAVIRAFACDGHVGRRRLRSFARLGGMAAFGTSAGVAAGLVLALAVPFARGGGAFAVLSGSMEPVIHTGDVVLVGRIAPTDARVGDVVTFRDPEGTGRLITHRVRSVQVRERTVRLVTKGDAANGLQRWSVPADGSLGRVQYRLWKLGYALGWIHGPLGRLLLVAVPAVALAISTLARIWRGPTIAVAGFVPRVGRGDV